MDKFYFNDNKSYFRDCPLNNLMDINPFEDQRDISNERVEIIKKHYLQKLEETEYKSFKFDTPLIMVKSKVKTLTRSNFRKNVFESNKMWIVKFYAPWCSPCRRLDPIWKKAAKKLKGKCEFCELDGVDIHHLEPQEKADVNNYIRNFHKNHLFYVNDDRFFGYEQLDIVLFLIYLLSFVILVLI